jgi:zinc transport system substrate-binding protein
MKAISSILKLPAVALLLTFMLMAMTACGGNSNAGSESNNTTTSPAATDAADQATDEAISVVTSFYPLYFLASEIGGKHVAAFNLIPAGVEPHDWTPKSRDITTASKAQLFLYHGAGLEGWVDGFLSGLDKNSGVITKEMSEGITLIAGSGEEHAEEEGHDHGDMDPHTWVSPKSALKLAENVKNSLVEIDAANQADYEQNYEQLKQKLETIDQAYTEQLAQVPNKNIVVSHQAFGYLARDYGLKQVAIMGLSPDAEPRAQDLLKIAKFVKENNVKYIFFEELVSDQLANTLAGEADVDTMVLNPLEGLTPDQEKAGDTYLTLMERNLQNLVQALQ